MLDFDAAEVYVELKPTLTFRMGATLSGGSPAWLGNALALQWSIFLEVPVVRAHS